jgi:hypothetical protein
LLLNPPHYICGSGDRCSPLADPRSRPGSCGRMSSAAEHTSGGATAVALLFSLRYPCLALAVLPPRFSSPRIFCAGVAMSVQYGEVLSKAIQDIVLYCLTPVRFRRYSSLNLCRALSSRGRKTTICSRDEHRFGHGRNPSVNSFNSAVSIPMLRNLGETWRAHNFENYHFSRKRREMAPGPLLGTGNSQQVLRSERCSN